MLFYFSCHQTQGDVMKRMTEKQVTKHMKSVDERRKTLEDGVQSVCKGFTSALFVWGPGGLGKTHLLKEMLETMSDKVWRHHTAHSTPKGLFLSLYMDQSAIHLYEDCEKVIKAEISAAILRAACGAPSQSARRVTYETNTEKLSFEFTGGIIIATNENLSRTNGPLQAVASRFRPIKWDLTMEERIACVLTIAKDKCVRNGIEISAKESTKVAWELIDMTTDSSGHLDLDLRLFTEHALPAYAQSKQDSGMKWRDLMQSKLLGMATTMHDTQAERTRKLQQLAQKINAEPGNTKTRVAKWKEATGLGQAIYFRHLRSSKMAK